jgi:hypothetical protein
MFGVSLMCMGVSILFGVYLMFGESLMRACINYLLDGFDYMCNCIAYVH